MGWKGLECVGELLGHIKRKESEWMSGRPLKKGETIQQWLKQAYNGLIPISHLEDICISLSSLRSMYQDRNRCKRSFFKDVSVCEKWKREKTVNKQEDP
jgi:hypothetical protein